MASIVQKLKRYVGGANELQRINRSTTVGGYTGVDNENKFVQYEQMTLMSPHVFVPLHKTSLTLCKKYHFESANKNEELVKDFEAWAKRTNFGSKLRTLVRLTLRNGTFVARWEDEDGKSEPENMSFEPLIMSKTTIIPEGFNPDDPAVAEGMVLSTPIAEFRVNEGDDELEVKYNPEDVVYVALYPYDYVQKDIKKRDTYGLYGISLLESVVDIFNKYMDVVEGFAKYVKKYGNGRYNINYKILEQMILDGNVEEAIEIMNMMKVEHAMLQENEDIVSAGCEIKTLDTGGNSLSVTDFKESLENDIEVGLMASPITMGKGEGNTYASGYISESERILVLEGMQDEFASMINDQIIRPRAIKLKGESFAEKWQDEIQLVFEDIAVPSIPLADLIAAYTNDLIDYEQFCKMIDIKPLEKPPENGVNPTKIQVEQAQLNREQQQANMDKQQQFNAKIQAEAIKKQGRPEVGGKSSTQLQTERSQRKQERANKKV